MFRSLIFSATILAIALTTGCKHTDQAAKQQGANLAAQRLQQPIEQARAVTSKAEKSLPVLLDATALVYHKLSCKDVDPSLLETMTLGQAEERGAKPDPVCLPGP